MTVLLLTAGCAARHEADVETLESGIEARGWDRPSTSTEVGAFVDELARRSKFAEVRTLGHSSQGKPIRALLLSKDLASFEATRGSRPLTIMILGSQHGTEPSGTAAIQALARDLIVGVPQGTLDRTNYILIPDGNPDGRDARKRVNGNGVNLSTNYTTLSEPEARVVEDALYRWQPDVLIDVHESAILKKKSLGAQGWMTDFEAQLEYANHPNVDRGIAELSSAVLLPEILSRVNESGLRAQRYTGEITDVAQPITNGGLSMKNLRNKAGMLGVVTFLIENRLDPLGPTYPTYRNLQERVRKQRLTIQAILDVSAAHEGDIRATTKRARGAWQDVREPPLYLVTAYALDTAAPTVTVPLRRIDTDAVEQRTFARHTTVVASEPVVLPRAYVVTGHHDDVAEILDRHHIAYQRLTQPTPTVATLREVRSSTPRHARHGWGYTDYELEDRTESLTLPTGALWVPLRQPARRIIPLLLEPRSRSSLFQDAAWVSRVRPGEIFFVLRVEESPSASETRGAMEPTSRGDRPAAPRDARPRTSSEAYRGGSPPPAGT